MCSAYSLRSNFIFKYLFCIEQPPSLPDMGPIVGTSILNLAKALLIQKNNLESAMQRKFPPNERLYPSNPQRNVDRNRWRPGDNRSRSGQKNAESRSSKNTAAKKQESAQKESDTGQCSKVQTGIMKSGDTKGLYNS